VPLFYLSFRPLDIRSSFSGSVAGRVAAPLVDGIRSYYNLWLERIGRKNTDPCQVYTRLFVHSSSCFGTPTNKSSILLGIHCRVWSLLSRAQAGCLEINASALIRYRCHKARFIDYLIRAGPSTRILGHQRCAYAARTRGCYFSALTSFVFGRGFVSNFSFLLGLPSCGCFDTYQCSCRSKVHDEYSVSHPN